MIQGTVNAAYEAVVSLPLRGPAGQAQDMDAVVDTGFTRFLTLPPAMVAELGLGYRGVNSVILADGSETTLEVYGSDGSVGRPAKRGRCLRLQYDAPHWDVVAAHAQLERRRRGRRASSNTGEGVASLGTAPGPHGGRMPGVPLPPIDNCCHRRRSDVPTTSLK